MSNRPPVAVRPFPDFDGIRSGSLVACTTFRLESSLDLL